MVFQTCDVNSKVTNWNKTCELLIFLFSCHVLLLFTSLNYLKIQGKHIKCLWTQCFCKNRIIWLLTSKVLVSTNGVENTILITVQDFLLLKELSKNQLECIVWMHVPKQPIAFQFKNEKWKTSYMYPNGHKLKLRNE